MAYIASRAAELPRSGIRYVMDVVESMGRPVIRLEVGQPHFATPEHIIEAAHRAAREGFTRYTPNLGLPDVREAVAAKLESLYPGLGITPDRVALTSGGVFALAVAMSVVVQAGHKVLLPDPGWPNYTLQVLYLNAQPIYYPLRAENGFQPDIRDFEKIVTPDTDAVVVNTPANPTGALFTRERLAELADFAARRGLFVISDEVYDRITYDGEKHVPFLSVSPAPDRVITVNSLSKAYAMTGWRIGYAILPASLVEPFAKVSEALIACPSAVSQKAAKAALEGPDDCVANMVEYYAANRDLLVRMLSEAGATFSCPRGAFYLLLDISSRTADPVEAALSLVRHYGVAVAPGSTFGPSGSRYIRISFCNDRDSVAEGAKRILRFLAGERRGDIS